MSLEVFKTKNPQTDHNHFISLKMQDFAYTFFLGGMSTISFRKFG